MKIWLLAVVFSVGSAFAAPITFVGALSGANENPANASAGTGFATVVFDAVLHTLSVDVTFSGLTGTTTASHIHCCALPGTNATVATELPSFSNLPLGVTSGSFTQTYDTSALASYNPAFVGGGTAATAEAALLAGLLGGQAYLNIHSSFKGAGEIRANLVATPEPGAMALMGIGTIAMMFLLSRSTRTAKRL